MQIGKRIPNLYELSNRMRQGLEGRLGAPAAPSWLMSAYR